ncbi:MAG: hypothetical protein HOP30_11125 [Cyclobacteriaceae bacterium]|nr:hypothetical protein [Cyclobacteriaceae bacterium]
MAKQIKKSRVLRLVLKKKWFDMFSNGKTEEYRAISPYWIARLMECKWELDYSETITHLLSTGHNPEKVMKHFASQWRKFEWVEILLGYQKNREMKLAMVKRIRIGKPKRKWCEPEDVGKLVFVIELEIL